jgi:hypothetical protein
MLCQQSFGLILVNLHEHSVNEQRSKTCSASAFPNKAAPLYRIEFDCQGQAKLVEAANKGSCEKN